MGTFDSTAFRSHGNKEGGETVMFNGPGDGAAHGKVVMDSAGEVVYARDVEGNVYVNKQADS
jgi:hypothetical protein